MLKILTTYFYEEIVFYCYPFYYSCGLIIEVFRSLVFVKDLSLTIK